MRFTRAAADKFAPCLLLLAFAAAGCGGSADKGRFPGDISKIERGMNTTDIETKIGPPAYMNEGEDHRAGNDVWVYPKGYLILYRRVVRAVVPVDNPADLPPRKNPREIVGSTRRLDPFEKEDEFYQKSRRKNSIDTSPDQWDDNIYRSF